MRRVFLVGLGLILVVAFASYFVWKEQPTQQSIEQQTMVQDENEDLLGKWSLYSDCPNTIFTFEQRGVVELESCDGEYQDTSSETGTYAVADENVVATFPKSGDYPFTLINKEDEQKLRLVRFDQEFILFKVQR